MNQVAKFVRKSPVVEIFNYARTAREADTQARVEWTSGTANDAVVTSGSLTIHPGDQVVKDQHGNISVISTDDLFENYEFVLDTEDEIGLDFEVGYYEESIDTLYGSDEVSDSGGDLLLVYRRKSPWLVSITGDVPLD